MRAVLRKRLNALEASLAQQTRKPIELIDVDDFDPADRDAFLDGDGSILNRYGFDPDDSSPGIRAIIISVHPDHREAFDMANMDDEEFERMERRREADDRRRQAEERERTQLEAIQAAEADPPSAVIGWRRNGEPVYDDEPRMSTNWVDSPY